MAKYLHVVHKNKAMSAMLRLRQTMCTDVDMSLHGVGWCTSVAVWAIRLIGGLPCWGGACGVPIGANPLRGAGAGGGDQGGSSSPLLLMNSMTEGGGYSAAEEKMWLSFVRVFQSCCRMRVTSTLPRGCIVAYDMYCCGEEANVVSHVISFIGRGPLWFVPTVWVLDSFRHRFRRCCLVTTLWSLVGD